MPIYSTDQYYSIIIFISAVLEGDAVSLHVREILLSLLGCTRSKTLVVFDLPGMVVLSSGLPTLKLWQAKEGNLIPAL